MEKLTQLQLLQEGFWSKLAAATAKGVAKTVAPEFYEIGSKAVDFAKSLRDPSIEDSALKEINSKLVDSGRIFNVKIKGVVNSIEEFKSFVDSKLSKDTSIEDQPDTSDDSKLSKDTSIEDQPDTSDDEDQEEVSNFTGDFKYVIFTADIPVSNYNIEIPTGKEKWLAAEMYKDSAGSWKLKDIIGTKGSINLDVNDDDSSKEDDNMDGSFKVGDKVTWYSSKQKKMVMGIIDEPITSSQIKPGNMIIKVLGKNGTTSMKVQIDPSKLSLVKEDK
jgi:hypothetical protein